MFSSRTMLPDDWKGLQNFKASEFKHPEKMGYEFMVWLDKVRTLANVPMFVSSSYRDPGHNKAVHGAKDSAHSDIPCNAVDIRMAPTADDPNWNLARYRIQAAAQALGCIRIGIYLSGSMHLDRTEDRRPAPRFWIAVDNPA